MNKPSYHYSNFRCSYRSICSPIYCKILSIVSRNTKVSLFFPKIYSFIQQINIPNRKIYPTTSNTAHDNEKSFKSLAPNNPANALGNIMQMGNANDDIISFLFSCSSIAFFIFILYSINLFILNFISNFRLSA